MNKLFLRLGLVALLMLAFFSCKQADTHQNLIPKDADAVFIIKPKQIADKAELSSEENINLFKKLAEETSDEESKKNLIDFIDNPSDLGVDFESPIYVFYNFSEKEINLDYFGISFRCTDDIETSLLREDAEMRFADEFAGFKIYKGVDREDFAVAVKEEQGLLLVSSNETFEEKLYRILEQMEEKTFASTELFAKINETKEDIQGIINCSSIQNSYAFQKAFIKNPIQKELLEQKKKGYTNEDLYYIFGLNAEKGVLKLMFEVYSEDKAMQELIKENSKLFPTSKEQFFDFLPKNNLFIFNFSINGASIWEQIQNLAPNTFPNLERQNKKLSEVGINIEDIFKALKGDCTCSLSGSLIDFQQKDFDFRTYLELADREAPIKLMNKVLEDTNLDIIKTAENQYLVETEVPVRFGLKDNIFFFSTKKLGSTDELFEKADPSIKESRYANELLGKRVAMVIDLAEIVDIAKPFMGFVLPVKLINRLELLDYLASTSTDKITQSETTLKLKSDKNPYALMLDVAREVANK